MQQQNVEFLQMLQDDIDNFSMEQHIQLDESDLDEAIEIWIMHKINLIRILIRHRLIKTMMTMTVIVVLKI